MHAIVEARTTKEQRKVILGSSLGSIFEFYDLYLFGSLAAVIAKQFFSGLNPTTGFIVALLTFAAGFIVRPFGALFFGRVGDMVGRKYTFLVTIGIMGLSTFVVGLLPSYSTIGIAAPIILIALRLLQGLAIGGEYGGAATYVAEHAPQNRRGYYTSWIQISSPVGLLLSLGVILVCRQITGAAFDDWGWRLPFLLSIILFAISVWIRLTMDESPAFQKMKMEGKVSKAPITESFARWSNLKVVLLVLFGLMAGQATVSYTGQFYSLFFLGQVLKVDPSTVNLLQGGALLIASPFYIVFGILSDKIGRKWIIMGGCLLGFATSFPIFQALTHYANPALERAQNSAPITVTADPADCSFQFNPTGTAKFTSSCDVAKQVLTAAAATYKNVAAAPGTTATIKIGDLEISSYNSKGLTPDDAKKREAEFKKAVSDGLIASGYPTKANPDEVNVPMTLLLLTILIMYVVMVYAPTAAMLVELFPTRIRYTSMSLPYHIGFGWFGGLLPSIVFALSAQNGNIYFGLWYPVLVAVMTFVIGAIWLPETKDVDINSVK
jgi:hypothetical protein